MKIRPNKALTFEDVLLIPRRSPIKSRNDVSTITRLTATIKLNIPVISANMDTVTEAAMAIAIAQSGGIGILHRFMTVDQQVKQAQKVKRARGFIVENPYSIRIDASVAEAANSMRRHDVGGLVVNDENGRFAGIVSRRDILLSPPEKNLVRQVMTRRKNIVSAKPGVTPEEARAILYEHRLEKLPVLDDDGNLHGLITAQDIIRPRTTAALDEKGRLRVGAAIGVTSGELERAEALLEAGVDVLVLDIAHGHADHCIEMVKSIRARFPSAQVIAGNVATLEGARDLAEAGADAIKVGIGPGSICTTRIVTGFGVPQLTAIMDSVAGIEESGRDIPIIADGGIQKAGDMVKALAAGAETVMIGSLFAGTEESPGSAVIRDGQKFKVVRGMASLAATMGRRAAENRGDKDESAEDPEDWDKVVPEGVEAVVPYRGHVAEVLHQLVGGLRSGLSYGGARTIHELQENAEFVEISPAGIRESGSHDVDRL